MGKYYGVPMHMHSCWERNASMEGHMYQLNKLGIEYTYFTDHDVRMGRRKFPVEKFDFSQGKLYIEETPTLSHGFQNLVGSVTMTEENELCLSTVSDSAEWTVSSTTFDSLRKRHEMSLISNIMIHLGMRMTEPDDDIRIVVDVELSIRPPEFYNGHILYVFGNYEGLEDEYHVVKPMNVSGEKYTLALLEDAANIGGGDNVFRTISFSVASRNKKSAKLFVNHLSTSWDHSFEEGRQIQKTLAEKIGKKYGITPFVAFEISDAGWHKNCFSTHVPVLNYEELGFTVSEEYAVNHVLSHGGIFAINHPFEIYKRVLWKEPERKEEVYQTVLNHLLSNHALGATLMEVGFPMGRSEFSIEEHLKLWDVLTGEGIVLTGYGDSDSHGNMGFFEDNNFVGYIYADEPGEDAFVQSMKAGNLYTGDPVYLQKMTVSFTDGENRPMGCVVYTDRPGRAVLSIDGIKEEMTLIWNVNGKDLAPIKVTGDYCGEVEIPAEGKVNFARVALYHNGRCIMLTNPVHTTFDKEFFDSLAEERKFVK